MNANNRYKYTDADIRRIAYNAYQIRILNGETWGTSEGDYKYAEQKCKEWWGTKVDETQRKVN